MTMKKMTGFLALLVALAISGECSAGSAFVEQTKQQEKQKKEAEQKKKLQEKEAEKKKKEDEKKKKQQEKEAEKQKKRAAAQGKKSDPKCMKGCQHDRDENNSGDLKADLNKYDVCTRKC